MQDEPIGLTAFLLRQDQVAAFDKQFPPTAAGALPLAAPLQGYFLPLPSAGSIPRWVTAVDSILEQSPGLNLRAQNPGGLLVVKRDQRTFVVTFGHGWQKLEDEWLERDFGRRVALNSIAKNGLVEIRAEQVFARWHLASDRAPRASAVEEFGVEFDRDLVASVEGVPSDKSLGKTIRGSTNLRLNLPIGLLADVLDKAQKLFASTAYRKHWPEIDNLSPVKEQTLAVQLDAQLDTELASGTAIKKLVLFTPAHRRDEALTADSYVFGRMSKTPATTPYLTVDSWLNHLAKSGEEPSVGTAKQTAVHLMDETKSELKACSVYDCFGCEIGFNGNTYVLSSGTWYEVVPEFLNRINKAVAKIGSPAITLPAWNQIESEGEYNARCAKGSGFLHFDAKSVMFGGGQSKVEFCDVLHPKSQTMVFAKIVSKSSGMSHLVEQVRRTAELCFAADPAFRKELKKVFGKHHPKADSSWLESRPRAGDWSLCLVSLGRPAKTLPFFAKCALVKLTRDLHERGHEISFVNV